MAVKPRGRGRPFVKGQSGNPSGRPKVVGEVVELARQHTTVAINTLVSIAKAADQPASARVAAAIGLLDRGWGKAPQEQRVTAEDGAAIAIYLPVNNRD